MQWKNDHSMGVFITSSTSRTRLCNIPEVYMPQEETTSQSDTSIGLTGSLKYHSGAETMMDTSSRVLASLSSNSNRSPYFSRTTVNDWDNLPPDTSLIFRHKKYPSASAALEDYINDFDGKPARHPSPRDSRDVYSLLNPGLSGSLPLSHACSNSVTMVDAIQEVRRLQAIRKQAEESYYQILKQQRTHSEVDAALKESTKLLSQVTLDNTSSLPGSSLQSSRNTQHAAVSQPQGSHAVDQADEASEPSSIVAGHGITKVQKTQSDILGKTLRGRPSPIRAERTMDTTKAAESTLSGEALALSDLRHTPQKATITKSRVSKHGGSTQRKGDLSISDYDLLQESLRRKILSPQDREAIRQRLITLETSNPSWLLSNVRSKESVTDVKSMDTDDLIFAPANGSSLRLGNRVRSNSLNLPEKEAQNGTSHQTTFHNSSDPTSQLSQSRGISYTQDLTSKIFSSASNSRNMTNLSIPTLDGELSLLAKSTPKHKQYVSRLIKEVEASPSTGSIITSNNTRILPKHQHFADSLIKEVENSPSSIVTVRTAARQNFASNLMQEINESGSSIITTAGPPPRHKNFVSNLMHEVDESPSSIATAPNLMLHRDVDVGRKVTKESMATEVLLNTTPVMMTEGVDIEGTTAAMRDRVSDSGASSSYLGRVRDILTGPTPGKSPSQTDSSRSPDTEAVLDGDRPWEVPRVTRKPPKPVHEETTGPKDGTIVDRFLEDCLGPASQSETQRLSGTDQPGTLEALKNMLFTMQSVATSAGALGSEESVEDTEVPSTSQEWTADDLSKQVSNQAKVAHDSDFEDQPGGMSLEKAMMHLSRLKTLVQRDNQIISGEDNASDTQERKATELS